MEQPLYKQLSDRLLGMAFTIQNILGRGQREGTSKCEAIGALRQQE